MTTDWAFFVKIICSSLDKRTGRRQEAAMFQFVRVGPAGRVA
jgi:hypothetical protein